MYAYCRRPGGDKAQPLMMQSPLQKRAIAFSTRPSMWGMRRSLADSSTSSARGSSLHHNIDASGEHVRLKADASSNREASSDKQQGRHCQNSEAFTGSSARTQDLPCAYVKRRSSIHGDDEDEPISTASDQPEHDDDANQPTLSWQHQRTTVVDILKDTMKRHADFNRALEQLSVSVGSSSNKSPRSRRYTTV